jgi:hypothetical protein
MQGIFSLKNGKRARQKECFSTAKLLVEFEKHSFLPFLSFGEAEKKKTAA